MAIIKHGMLRVDVYNRIRENILSQMYKPGEALAEDRISKSLGVSRTPVREAFAQLNMDGLVDSIPNKGVVVRKLDVQDIQDMYDIRAHVEGIAARRASVNISADDIEKIRDLLKNEKILVETGDIAGFQASDFDFHDSIIKPSGSRVFENFLKTIIQQTRIARVRSLSSDERTAEALLEHSEIFEAICNKNSDLAQKLMQRHILRAKDNFIRSLIAKETKPNE